MVLHGTGDKRVIGINASARWSAPRLPCTDGGGIGVGGGQDLGGPNRNAPPLQECKHVVRVGSGSGGGSGEVPEDEVVAAAGAEASAEVVIQGVYEHDGVRLLGAIGDV